MLRELGLGVVMRGAATDLKKAVDVARTGFEGIKNSIVGMNSVAGSSKFGNFINALNFTKLTDIKNQLGEYIGMDKDISRLTNTFESNRVQIDEMVSTAAVGLALSSKELNRWKSTIQSAALATNSDIGSAVESFKALTEQGVDIKKFGLTFTEFLKTSKLLGMSGEQLSNTFSNMTTLGLDSKTSMRLIDDMVLIAEKGHLGAAGLTSVETILNELGPLLTNTFQRKGPEAVADMVRSTQGLAAVMQDSLGIKGSESIQAALSLTTKMQEARNEYRKLFVGMGEFPELIKTIATNTGSVDEAMALLDSDSLEFIKRLRTMSQTASAKGGSAQTFMDKFAFDLAEINPELTKLLTQGPEVERAFAKIGDVSKPIEGAAGRTAKAVKQYYRSGRTLSDSVQLSMDMFEQKVRDIRGAKIDQLFYRKVIPAMDRFALNLTQTASKDGPMGMFVRKLSEFQKIGGAAFLPLDSQNKEIAGMAEQMFIFGKVTGMTVDVMQPYLDSMMKIAIVLPFLTSGLTGAVGGLLGVGATIGKPFGAILSAVGILGKSALIPFSGLLTKLGYALGLLLGGPLSALGVSLAGLGSVFATITSIGGVLLTGVFAAIPLALAAIAGAFLLASDGGGRFVNKIVTVLDWGLGFVAGWIDSAANYISNFADNLLEGNGSISAAFSKAFERLGKIFGTFAILKPAVKKLGGALLKLFKLSFTSAFESLKSTLSFDGIGIGSLFSTDDTKGSGLKKVGSNLSQSLSGMLTDVSSYLSDKFVMFSDFDYNKTILEPVSRFFDYVFEAISGFDIAGKLSGLGDKYLAFVTGFFSKKDGTKSIGSALGEWVMGAVSSFTVFLMNIDWLGVISTYIGKPIAIALKLLLDTGFGLISFIPKFLQSVFTIFSGIAKTVTDFIVQIVGGIFGEDVKNKMQAFVDTAYGLFDTFVGGFLQGISDIVETVSMIFGYGSENSLSRMIKRDFDLIMGYVNPVIDTMKSAFNDFWGLIQWMFGNSVNTVIGEDFGKIMGWVQPVLDSLKNAFYSVFESIKSIVSTASDVISTVITTVIGLGDLILTGITNSIKAAIDKLTGGFTFIKNIVTDMAARFGIKFESDESNKQVKAATSQSEQRERVAAKQEILAAGKDKDNIELLIGVARLGFNQLHTDMLQIGKVLIEQPKTQQIKGRVKTDNGVIELIGVK